MKYDDNIKSFILQTQFAKLYKASSTNPTTKAIENKQVYFKENQLFGSQVPGMKITVVIK